MRAGDLRHRVTFQRRSTIEDDNGETAGWVDVVTVHASVSPLSGRELLTAQTMNAEISHQVVVRFHSALSAPIKVAAMRILFGDRVFNVHTCMNVDERNRELIMMAAEGLTDG
jgi:SPP1 family predicted phage head-tail adaptor